MEPITTTTVAVAATSWSGAKLLGATFENIGNDLNQLYQKGKDSFLFSHKISYNNLCKKI